MRTALVIGMTLAGCFGPGLPADIRCDEGLCPAGLVCDDGLCRDRLSVDAGAAIDADVPVDASVDAAPVCATLTFQDGEGGYDATDDTTLRQDTPDQSLGNRSTVEWDDENADTGGGQDHGLLRFNEVFGVGADQVPAGAEIVSAVLTLTVVEQGSGDPGALSETAVDWTEQTSFSEFGGAAGVQAGDVGSRVADAPTDVGPATIDVTMSVAGGSEAGVMPGWIFAPLDGNPSGVQVASSESLPVGSRPRLEISFCD